MVDLTDQAVTAAVCPPPPEENDCEDCGCLSPDAGGPPGGSAPPSGGGGTSGGPGTGPGVLFHHKAGGIGRPNQPGSLAWPHGRYWSHTYAAQIVQGPISPDTVYLVTEHATWRTFVDENNDSTYEVVSPESEYRTLVRTGSGWTLTDLDGTVTSFRLDGRWVSTVDRNGNAITSTYNGGQLDSVHMPDGRREDFRYDGAGKVIEVDEVGVDGITLRTWIYTWTGQSLTRIDRPDGTALEYRYDDPMHDGYITRVRLIGADGTSERILTGFEYDIHGNVVKLWAGAVDFVNGVGKWELSYDDPIVPTMTTITDPLGNVSTRTWETRTRVTRKARLSRTDGDCPVCGTGPNTQLGYNDPSNPYRVTDQTDGRGNVTKYQYDLNGQVTSRIEAFTTPLERETTYAYEPAYPAFATTIAQPSVLGAPNERLLVHTYDAAGNRTMETREGFEDGQPFTYTTLYGHNAGGRVTSINPPGHGTADVTTFTYDPLRGNGHLVLETRTDPLVGTTTFGHDAFNRRISMTDPNGVITETHYDAANRVTFQIRKGAIPAEDLITENRYDTFGDLFQTVLPEGNVIEYSYDAAGRLLTIERKPDDQPTTRGERVRFELDGFGNRVLEAQERWEGGAWVEHAR
ncbi:MAG: hypothetical protein MI919_30500, partial [Holophagales bacterium]|nr:hypothetical protein [Holophagales bacterium]